jgi:bifunctional non-homologous end joining protein LigD
LPLTQRRESLAILIPKRKGPLCVSAELKGSPSEIWKQITRQRHEGVIAKRCDSPYEPGQRSGAWVKIKRQNEQEFVIGGYTPPHGSRKYFGSLLLGMFDGGKLIFVSRVGTGFDFGSLKSLHQLFQRHRSDACPFSNLPTRRAGRFGQGVTAADMRHCAWLEPKLVCQVRFFEWTADNSLRQPVFIGLRDDKQLKDVVREKAS